VAEKPADETPDAKDEGDITVTLPSLQVIFTAHGATIKQASMPDQLVNPAKKEKRGLELLAEIEPGRRTFGLPVFDVGAPVVPGVESKARTVFEKDKSLDNHIWKLESDSKTFDQKGKYTVVYSISAGGKYKVTKKFALQKEHQYVTAEIGFENNSGQLVTYHYVLNGPAGILLDGPPDDPKGPSKSVTIIAQLAGREATHIGEQPATPEVKRVDAINPDALAEEKRKISQAENPEEKQRLTEAAEEKRKMTKGENVWGSVKNRFYIAMLVSIEPKNMLALLADPMTPQKIANDLRYSEPNLTIKGERRDSDPVEAGKAAPADEFALYVGPNSESGLQQATEQLNRPAQNLSLETAFQYCDVFNTRWPRVDWIASKMMWFFNLLYKVFGNYGVAVILLTLSIKLALHPLTRKQQVSMNKVQKLQPELKKIQEKYKGQTSMESKQKLMAEQQDLMKREGASMQGGCLPMLIQMPVLYALYGIFNHAFPIRGAEFLWIKDLSQADHFGMVAGYELNLLPLFYAGIQFLQTKLYPQQPKSDDPQQQMSQQMMTFMPLLISFMFYKLPAGLLLYFAASALFGMIESYYIRKFIIKNLPAAGTPAAPAKK